MSSLAYIRLVSEFSGRPLDKVLNFEESIECELRLPLRGSMICGSILGQIKLVYNLHLQLLLFNLP